MGNANHHCFYVVYQFLSRFSKHHHLFIHDQRISKIMDGKSGLSINVQKLRVFPSNSWKVNSMDR